MQQVSNNRLSTIAAAGILGVAVGDALGVPVEFQNRQCLTAEPVTGMRGSGTHNQPAGTWSDDTSLTLCLVESLCDAGIDYHDQARRFGGWLLRAEWTSHGEVFDVGNATREAIFRLASGVNPTTAGSTAELSNGNGSLMRILPLALYLAYADPAKRIDVVMQCSRLTHGHPRCQVACAFYVEVAAGLVRGIDLSDAVAAAQDTMTSLLCGGYAAEQPHFTRLLSYDIGAIPESEVSSSGYVIHCLEAGIWCALQAKTYAEGVLRAVNLGDDTDTTGAVTGGLLGLRFGIEAIPADWQASLARSDEILSVCDRFQQICQRRWEVDR